MLPLLLPLLSGLSTQAQSGLFACGFLVLFFLIWAKKTRGNFITLVIGCIAIMLVLTRWDMVVHVYQTVAAQAQAMLAKGGK